MNISMSLYRRGTTILSDEAMVEFCRIAYGPLSSEEEGWLRDYWEAQWQFGPLDVGPKEYLEQLRGN